MRAFESTGRFGLRTSLTATLALVAIVATARSAGAANGERPALEVVVTSVSLRAGQVDYCVQLVNRSEASIGDVTLKVGLPGNVLGTKVLSSPPGSAATFGPHSIVWTLKSVPGTSIVGPLAYRATVHGVAKPVSATAHWKLPRPGAAAARADRPEDATATDVTVRMANAPLADVAGAGLRYFVPTGDRGQVVVKRLDVDPPAIANRTWVAVYQVTKEKPGSLVLVVPLRFPAPAHSVLHAFADHGDGIFRAQPLRGTVTADGQHAAFAVDGNTVYALGISDVVLNSAFDDIDRLGGEVFAGDLWDAIVDGKSILSTKESLADLISTLRTDDLVVIDQGSTWVVVDTDGPGGGAPVGGDSTDAVSYGCTDTACFWYDPTVPACGGGGGQVEVYGGGGYNVACDNGTNHSCTADGGCIDEPCTDRDQDGHCACTEGASGPGCDSNDNNASVHFAPVPGCGERLCFFDATTASSLPVSTLEGAVEGLSATLAGVLEKLLVSYSSANPIDAPTVVHFDAPTGPSAGPQGIIGVLDSHIAMFVHGSWTRLSGSPQIQP